MKRTSTLVLAIILICALLSSCGAKAENPEVFENIKGDNKNYNNYLNGNGSSLTFGDKSFYYPECGFDITAYYSLTADNGKIESNKITDNCFSFTTRSTKTQYSDGYLYFISSKDDTHSLYRYSISEKTEEKVMTMDYLEQSLWVVSGNYLVYDYKNEGNTLCGGCQNIENGDFFEIKNDIFDFGVYGDCVTVVADEPDDVSVTRYDLVNQTFTDCGSLKFGLEKYYYCYSFSESKIVCFPADSRNMTVVIYDTESQELTQVTFESGVFNIYCGDDIAYVFLNDDANDIQNVSLYRLDMNSGEYEICCESVGYVAGAYVVNDNEIFFSTYDDSVIEKTHVYFYSYEKGLVEAFNY